MANLGLIVEDHIKIWDQMLASSPLINNNVDSLHKYVSYLDRNLKAKERGADLGLLIQIVDGIQGAKVDAGVFDHANRISAECNNRMLAHLLYNKEVHELNFIDNDVASNAIPALVDMAVEVMTKFDLDKDDEEEIYIKIGIEGITYIAQNILD